MKIKLSILAAILAVAGCANSQPSATPTVKPVPDAKAKVIQFDRCTISVIQNKQILPYGVGSLTLDADTVRAKKDNDDYVYDSGKLYPTKAGDLASQRGELTYLYAEKKKYFIIHAEAKNSAMLWDCSGE